jgi:hypothetical protein
MSSCPTLNAAVRKTVDFDPSDIEHLEAFQMLCLGTDGGKRPMLRQHPTLRFNVEFPFADVRVMMFQRIAEAHIAAIARKPDGFI